MKERAKKIVMSYIWGVKESPQLKLLASVLIFSTILAQCLFQTAANVFIANLLSGLLILPFSLLVFQGKFFIPKPLMFYCAFIIFSLVSVLWHDVPHHVEKSTYRSLILVAVFLVVFYNIVRNLHCFDALRRAYMASIWVNFFIYISGFGQGFFGKLKVGNRFQGTFENSNELGILSLVGIIFSFWDTGNRSPLLRKLTWLTIGMGSLLVLSSGSKKAIAALLMTHLLYLPSYFKKLNQKEKLASLIAVLAGLLVVAFYSSKLNLAKIWRVVTVRFERFFNELGSSFGASHASSTSERQHLIELGLKGFVEEPFVGHGVNAFVMHPSHGGLYSHNNYVELLYNTGLVGFLLYYSMHILLLTRIFRLRSRDLRRFLLIPQLLLLAFDAAQVSYSYKMTLYLFFFLLAYCEYALEQQAFFFAKKAKGDFEAEGGKS